MTQLQVGFFIYPEVIQLDVTAAYQVLSFPSNIETYLVGKTLTPVLSNEDLTLTPMADFNSCPQLDVICVPGGGMGQVEVMQDEVTLEFLRSQSEKAKYVTSVCTGSLILAAAQLLQGYKATCHWAFRDQLEIFGVEVVPDRVVVDRNRITGSGVTSGIDFGLTLLSLLCDTDTAKMTQLMMEYDPQPPFNSGTPATAERQTVKSLLQAGQPLIDAFKLQTRSMA